MNENRRLIVVLGMHRSGTTVITRALQALGVDLGDHLLPPTEHNQKGYCEDIDVNSLNIELLNALGHNWDTLTPVLSEELASPVVAEFKVRALEILRKKIEATGCFGLKDPRISRLLPFWQEVFKHLTAKISYVIACRNPMSVARSLSKRDGFDLEKGCYLWLEHMLGSLVHTANRDRIVVSYDRLMEDPAGQLQRLAQSLGRAFDTESEEYADYHANFLDDSLRHTRYVVKDLYLNTAVPAKVAALYRVLETLAEDKAGPNDPEIRADVDRISEQFHEDFPALRYMQRCEERAVEREGQFASLNQAVAEREGQIASLNQAAAEREGQIASLNQAAAEREGQIASLNQAVAERDIRISANTRELQTILSSRSWKITRILRLAGRIYRGDWVAVQASIRNRQEAVVRTAVTEVGKCESQNTAVNDELKPVPCTPMPLTLPIDTHHKRILLVSHYCPSRAHGGGLRILDMYSQIKSTFPGVIIDLYTHKRPEIDWSYSDVQQIFDQIYFSSVEKLSPGGLSELCGVPRQYDVIDLQFHQSAHHLDQWRTSGGKILFTPMESLVRSLVTDVRAIIRRDTTFSVRKIFAGIKSAAEEIVFASKVDEVVCVSRTDASLLRFMCRSKKVNYLETAISNIEFSDAIGNKTGELKPEYKNLTILYVAYFGSETNIVALKWYLENVHSLVSNAVPEYKLQVVGRGDLSIFSDYESDSVEFVGEVPTLAPYINAAKVGIAPALGGSGFRGKINQYAIFGVPSVVSPVSAKGLAYEDGIDIYIADVPDIFADRCIRLLKDNVLNKTMGQQAREKAFSKYSWESKIDAIRKIYTLEEA